MNNCLASLASIGLHVLGRPSVAAIPTGAAQCVRHASGAGGGMRKPSKKKKAYKTYRIFDLGLLTQFSLCDAMRYLRAAEVGRSPSSVKYDLALKLKAMKNGPIVRNRLRLPHPVKSDERVAVICPDDMAEQARQLGAVVAGEAVLFEKIRAGDLDFNRLVCHSSSEKALKKQNVGRILGPRGLMPSLRTKTISNNLEKMMDEMVGTDEYKERTGVVRLPIGRLSFTPRQLADNIQAVVASVKRDISEIEEHFNKAMDELVLSTTNGPGLSLSGNFSPTDSNLKPEDLEGPM